MLILLVGYIRKRTLLVYNGNSFKFVNTWKEMIMSFANDLKKPFEEDKSSKYQWADSRTLQCIGAIKEACLEARKKGERHIKGFFDGVDTDYGSYSIRDCDDCGMFFPVDTGLPFDYWKEQVEKELIKLGFTRFKVEIIRRPERKEAFNFWGKRVIRETGRMLAGMRVEVFW